MFCMVSQLPFMIYIITFYIGFTNAKTQRKQLHSGDILSDMNGSPAGFVVPTVMNFLAIYYISLYKIDEYRISRSLSLHLSWIEISVVKHGHKTQQSD